MSDVEAKNSSGVTTVELHGQTAAITAGGSGTAGSVALSDGAGARKVVITSGKSAPAPHPGLGSPAEAVTAGPAGRAGTGLAPWKAPPENLTLDGEHATIIVGSDRGAGLCLVTSDHGVATV